VFLRQVRLEVHFVTWAGAQRGNVMMTRVSAFAAATLAAVAMTAGGAWAQKYPSRPVKVIVAFTAGGSTDVVARLLAQRLAERLGQSFVIENKPGGGGNIGTEAAVRATPDGYTLLIDSVGPIAVNPTLYSKLAYDPQTDLVPIAYICNVPNVLVVPAALGVKTMEQFLAYAKAHSGELNYASTGVGTSAHLSSYMLASRAGFQATHIPYKGAEGLKDLLAGRIQFAFATIPSVIGHIQAGRLVAIAVSSPNRSRSLPDVPTVADSGFPGFEAGSWFALFAPKGTPGDVVTALNRETNEILRETAIEKRLVDEGADPVGGTPAELAAFVKSETEKWRAVVRESGAKAD
jgi:tripartite-type tricarboxylate transporter receptor subunit TctC